MSTGDEKWIRYDNLKRKKSSCRRTINIDGKAEYSWRQAHALYLVKSAGCSVLRAASTKPGERYNN